MNLIKKHKMKRILLFLVVFTAAVSCLSPSNFSQSWTSIATFEYVSNQEDFNKIFGADSLYYDVDTKIGIGWEYFIFYENVDKTTSEFKGGFMLSYLSIPSSGVTEGLQDNEYRVNTKSSSIEPNTYLVFRQSDDMPVNDMGFAFVPSDGATGSCIMQSCQVNNTVAVAKAVGDTFVPGDKLTLKAKGYLAGRETGTAEITLAEKSSSIDSVMYNWTQFDLSKLGSIDKIDFEIVAPEGKEIPQTVCIDNMTATISLMYQ